MCSRLRATAYGHHMLCSVGPKHSRGQIHTLVTLLLASLFIATGTCQEQGLPRWHTAWLAKREQVNAARHAARHAAFLERHAAFQARRAQLNNYSCGGPAEYVAGAFWNRFQPLLDSNVTLTQLNNTLNGFFQQAPERMVEELPLAWESRLVRNAIKMARGLGSSGPVHAVRLLQSFANFLSGAALQKQSLCMPVVRRTIVASILKLSLERGRRSWTDTFQQAVEAVMLALYRLHRRGAAGKGALEFFHVSKAGGTSMCELSVLNGCTASDTTLYGNCLMRRFNDGPRWVSHKEHAKVQPLPSMESLRWFHRSVPSPAMCAYHMLLPCHTCPQRALLPEHQAPIAQAGKAAVRKCMAWRTATERSSMCARLATWQGCQTKKCPGGGGGHAQRVLRECAGASAAQPHRREGDGEDAGSMNE